MDLKRRQPIGVELVKRGVVDEEDIERALDYQRQHPNVKIGDCLYELDACDPYKLITAIGEILGEKGTLLSRTSIKIDVEDYISLDIAKKNKAIPFEIENGKIKDVYKRQGIQGINFKKQTFNEKIPDWLKVEVNPGKEKKSKLATSGWFTNDLGEKLDKTEISLLRTAVGLIILFVIYSCFAILLQNQMEEKGQQAQESINDTNAQIQLAESDKTKIAVSYTHLCV